MSANLEQILSQGLQALAESTDLTQLDQVRVTYLGKKGAFTLQMKELGKLDPDQRRAVGQVINKAKGEFQQKLEETKGAMQQAALDKRLASESVDVTLPGRGQSIAGLHPVTITLRRISK
ncbi:MAG: phenylalanine--tRNA ligase subunit alpha, partial [Methylococcaceae bacterium]|nr:phenylalanine--tRNA ligase subunit alpha [Methylococcaceae bacterium]